MFDRTIEANSSIFSKVRSVFTQKDYYKTSTGIKIVTDRNHGMVAESANGEVFIDGVQNATIKGTRKKDNISLVNSTVATIDTKSGDDTIIAENSDLNMIYGGRGRDLVKLYNCRVGNISGGFSSDEIYAENSKIDLIDGQGGQDKITTHGGYVTKVADGKVLHDDITICNNPINPNPDDDYLSK